MSTRDLRRSTNSREVIDGNDIISLPNAAKIIGFSRQYLHKLFKRGGFIASVLHIEDHHYFSRRSVAEWKENRQKSSKQKGN